MDHAAGQSLFHGIFTRHPDPGGGSRLLRHPEAPRTLPDPSTGHHLQIATVDIGAATICPECNRRALGGYISFVSDLRVVYACPECRQMVWINGG
jgi:hypothetical protein